MEKLKKEIDDFITNFKTNIKRDYKEDNFFLYEGEKNYIIGFSELDKMWEVKLFEPKKITEKINVDISKINDKIFQYYKLVLDKYNYKSEDRKAFNEEIKFIFILLSNIYDLSSNFFGFYFEENWLKHPDLFYKIAIIADCVCYFCCCGHGYSFDTNYNNSGIKSFFIVIETFKYLEDNKISMDAITKNKMLITEYLFKHLGKNPSIVLLYKMGRMLNIDEMFNHIIKKTNLFQSLINKQSDFDIEHSIEGFEALITLSKNLETLFEILYNISPEKGVNNRMYREILKVISNIIANNNQVEYLENKLYNNPIFEKLIDTLKLDVYLGDYEGIWNIILDSTNTNIVTIFYRNKNKYNFGQILFNQVDNLIKNNLTSIRLNAVVRIMNYFLKLGDEIKKKYNVDNYYIEQFRDSYKKICDLKIFDDEDITEFKKYYETSC